jgi:hypothetical protein
LTSACSKSQSNQQHNRDGALEFTSIQAANKGEPNGDVSDLWTINYTMDESIDGRWYIDAATPYQDRLHTTC